MPLGPTEFLWEAALWSKKFYHQPRNKAAQLILPNSLVSTSCNANYRTICFGQKPPLLHWSFVKVRLKIWGQQGLIRWISNPCQSSISIKNRANLFVLFCIQLCQLHFYLPVWSYILYGPSIYMLTQKMLNRALLWYLSVNFKLQYLRLLLTLL